MPGETDYTTITVPEAVKQDLDEHRGSTPWGAFLEELRQEHADPITLNDAEEIAARVSESVDGVDTDTLAREIARQFDYSELANRVADELEGRMQ